MSAFMTPEQRELLIDAIILVREIFTGVILTREQAADYVNRIEVLSNRFDAFD